jgi:uncharacterized protein with WD repeat
MALYQGPSDESHTVVPTSFCIEGATLERYSRDGKFLAVSDGSFVRVFEVSEDAATELTVIERGGVSKLCFSPQSTYLLTWHRKKGDERELDGLREREVGVCGVNAV